MFSLLCDKELKFIIINNQSKKLKSTLIAEFPDIISLYCCYYLDENLMKFYSKDEVYDFF